MQLSKEEIEHVAHLARLQLTDKEKAKFSHQLTAILDWIDQLEEVDTKEVGLRLKSDLTNVMREDEVIPFCDIDSLNQAFPASQDNHLKVRGIK